MQLFEIVLVPALKFTNEWGYNNLQSFPDILYPHDFIVPPLVVASSYRLSLRKLSRGVKVDC